jgi:hypothetical protein
MILDIYIEKSPLFTKSAQTHADEYISSSIKLSVHSVY